MRNLLLQVADLAVLVAMILMLYGAILVAPAIAARAPGLVDPYESRSCSVQVSAPIEDFHPEFRLARN